MNAAMRYAQERKKLSQGNIVEKHKAAAPYYFFLSSIKDSGKTHLEPLSIQLFDILDPALGDLESSLQMNCQVELKWLMAQYSIVKQEHKPMTLLYANIRAEKVNYSHITAVPVKMPSNSGTHHAKMCVLAYKDGSLRICIHTANLMAGDWDNRTQGVWLSPLCPTLPLDSDSALGESPTHFKQDLIEYFKSYEMAELKPWLEKLKRTDFSHINVFFVGSTPGMHIGANSDKWSLKKMAKVLKNHVEVMPKDNQQWEIIAQCSSLGNFGNKPSSWLCGEFGEAMSTGIGLSMRYLPPIRLIFPSFANVAASHDGLYGGGALLYRRVQHIKQPWLDQFLFQWKSDTRYCSKAMPHIKSYTCVSPDKSQAAWFLLTSANMSKWAWGSQDKYKNLRICSYEAGVLFLPQFIIGSSCFPIKTEAAGDLPVFPMPYDLPLTQYSPEDEPWFMDD